MREPAVDTSENLSLIRWYIWKGFVNYVVTMTTTITATTTSTVTNEYKRGDTLEVIVLG